MKRLKTAVSNSKRESKFKHDGIGRRLKKKEVSKRAIFVRVFVWGAEEGREIIKKRKRKRKDTGNVGRSPAITGCGIWREL